MKLIGRQEARPPKVAERGGYPATPEGLNVYNPNEKSQSLPAQAPRHRPGHSDPPCQRGGNFVVTDVPQKLHAIRARTGWLAGSD